MKTRFLCAALLLTALATTADATYSSFDTDMDGWTGSTEITWGSSGGNPGGYLHFQDAGGSSVWATAPAAFLGDWSAYDGIGEVQYDHKIFSTGTSVGEYLPYRVSVYSDSDWAYWEGDTPSGPTDWVDIDVPLVASEWTVMQGSWSDILSDVTGLYLRIEHVSNSDHPNDIEGIDNVMLIPEPGVLGLLLVSGLMLRRRR